VRRPRRAEVYEKQLTANRQNIILAMLEIGDSTGEHLKISIPRIAAWAKLSRKTVQREIWGDHRKHPSQPPPKRQNGRDQECPFCPDSLITSRVLQPVTPANWKKHRPAEYRLNLELLDDCPEVRRYLDQRKLNFPPPQRPTVASPSVPRTQPQRPTDAPPSVPRTHDSRSIDPEPIDSEEGGFPRARCAGDQPDGPQFPPSPSLQIIAKSQTPPLAELAREFCQTGGFPLSNQKFIAEAIEAESRFTGLPLLEAARALAGHVGAARKNGKTIDRWWWQDCKWRELTKLQHQRLECDNARAAVSAAIKARAAAGSAAAPAEPMHECPDCRGQSGFQMVERDGRTAAVRCVHNGKQK
jgi:hypothetical protein